MAKNKLVYRSNAKFPNLCICALVNFDVLSHFHFATITNGIDKIQGGTKLGGPRA